MFWTAHDQTLKENIHQTVRAFPHLAFAPLELLPGPNRRLPFPSFQIQIPKARLCGCHPLCLRRWERRFRVYGVRGDGLGVVEQLQKSFSCRADAGSEVS